MMGMSESPNMPAILEILSEGVAESEREDDIWLLAESLLQAAIGHQLFTILRFHPGKGVVERIFSSDADCYPVGGEKLMGSTPWGEKVLLKGEPFIACSREQIQWAFPDYQLIFSLGLENALNVPVRFMGETLGTLNLLDSAGRYNSSDLALLREFAPVLAPAFVKMNSTKY